MIDSFRNCIRLNTGQFLWTIRYEDLEFLFFSDRQIRKFGCLIKYYEQKQNGVFFKLTFKSNIAYFCEKFDFVYNYLCFSEFFGLIFERDKTVYCFKKVSTEITNFVPPLSEIS